MINQRRVRATRQPGSEQPMAPETEQPLTMCQYASLASLLQQPRSGYDIARWFSEVTSHFWRVGHSAVYPALADLTRRALVVYESAASDKGPTRKIYHLTDAGRRTLLDWASQPAAEAEVRDEQVVKALCYGFVPTDTALALVQEARSQHLQQKQQYEEFVQLADALLAHAQATHDSEGMRSAVGQRLAARRGVGAQESYIAWCDEVIATLQSAPRS